MEEPEAPQEYVVFPEEAIKYLPEEWQQHLYALKEEGQGVLEAADDNLKILNRLVHAFPTMASLRYIQHRLASTKFEASMAALSILAIKILHAANTFGTRVITPN